MIRRYLLGLPRCAVLVVLTAVGVVMSLLAIAGAMLLLIGLLPVYNLIIAGARRLAGLGRRFTSTWGGLPVTVSYLPRPAPPEPRPDGWYAFGDQVFKSRRVVNLLRQYDWVAKDPANTREWVWLLITPLTGGLAAALPLALVAGAALAVARLPLTAAGPIALAGVALAVAIAPTMIRLYALWTREQLRPVKESWWFLSGVGPAVNRGVWAAWHGAGLAGLSAAAFGFGLLHVATIIMSGGTLLPWTATTTRPFLDYYRRYARQWTGREYARPYRPGEDPRPEPDGRYRVGRALVDSREAAVNLQRRGAVINDPATWRDLLWMLASPWLFVPTLIPAALIGFGFFGLVWQPIWWWPWALPIGLLQGIWISPFAMFDALPFDAVPGYVSPFLGLALAGAGVLLAKPTLKVRTWWDGLLLEPNRASRLALRVRDLTESRADAVDAQAAELRRIERDLHDGAQARLVAVGMSLATVEHLMQTDPDAARDLLAHARESSATALAELRDLVRGIHPPVLAERGLADAVRAVALDCPLPVAVTTAVPGRLEPAVESAAYFAVCETLANAVRHGGARTVTIDLSYVGERLTMTVRDDGRGGAEPSRGTGLSGITRRLGTFDGTLTLSSPAGGPTVVTMEIPCALSSPRTSTS